MAILKLPALVVISKDLLIYIYLEKPIITC